MKIAKNRRKKMGNFKPSENICVRKLRHFQGISNIVKSISSSISLITTFDKNDLRNNREVSALAI